MPTTKNLLAYDVSLEAFVAVNKALDTVPARSGHGGWSTSAGGRSAPW